MTSIQAVLSEGFLGQLLGEHIVVSVRRRFENNLLCSAMVISWQFWAWESPKGSIKAYTNSETLQLDGLAYKCVCIHAILNLHKILNTFSAFQVFLKSILDFLQIILKLRTYTQHGSPTWTKKEHHSVNCLYMYRNTTDQCVKKINGFHVLYS